MKLKLIITLLIILALYLIVALLLPLPAKSDNGPQIVLQVVSNGTEEKLVVPHAVVILRIAPRSGPTAKTPLSNGDTMICRAYDYQDESHITHAGFKCGEDLYVLMGIRYQGGK